jgi:phosphate transport system protein
MGKLATAMVVDALDSFINNDVQLARRVLESDHEVDALDRENFEGLINLMTADRQMVLPCSHLLLVNRNMERLADQATNIAEEVVFLVDAKIVRHREIQSRAASGDGAEAEDSEP